ncbi:ABC transporter permease [Desulfotruncus alcoholivorax]|uniref:ABC transporter permease n=1 Tax=Desulfotruncus alcoholivorax TaxID=265477 RepID=UPI0004144286|nr:ABC transporter permease [Desulfotruncus alcoholivorax]
MHINILKEVKSDYMGRTGLTILLSLLALALLAPLLTHYRPEDYTGLIFQPPSARHWLGTNDVGQDVWTQLLYGARNSLLTGGGAAVLAVLFSLLTGGSAALLGGMYDRVLMRLVDAMLVIPPVIVVILTAAYLKPNLLLLIVIISVFLWPAGARMVRAQTLALKESMHVMAARSFGGGRTYVLKRHLAPEMGPVLTAIIIQFARRSVFMEAGVSFLGISDPSLVSWGKMMQDALQFTYLDVWKWWLLPPGFALSLTIIGFTFTGTALETVMNPRLRKEVHHAGD